LIIKKSTAPNLKNGIFAAHLRTNPPRLYGALAIIGLLGWAFTTLMEVLDL
jgi:hypothetical protein